MAFALSVSDTAAQVELSRTDQRALLRALDALPRLDGEQLQLWRLLNHTSGDPDAERLWR